jgi:hypothetical protein
MHRITYSYSITPKGAKILESIEDENGNVATMKTFKRKEIAEKALESNKNCRNCVDCRDCLGCEDCTKCGNCHDCRECSNCTDSANCHGCHDSAHLFGCLCCEKSAFCTDCRHCGGLIHGQGEVDLEIQKISERNSIELNQIEGEMPFEILTRREGKVSSTKRSHFGDALVYCFGYAESSKFPITINPLKNTFHKLTIDCIFN